MGYAERAATEDTGARYEELRQVFVALLRARSAAELAATVPATPEWSVRDVLAHVTGITEDLNALDFDAAGPDEWTQAQVDRHRGEPLEATIAAWDREAPTFAGGLAAFGYGFGAHYIGDLLIHVTDVRAALGLTIDPDDPMVVIALDFYLDSLDEDLTDDGVGALEVTSGGEVRVVGPGPVRARVTATPFEMLRSCAGRRPLDAIARLDWTGEAERFVPHVSRYPVPTTDVGR